MTSPVARTIGDRIREHRYRLQLSQEELGEISGLHRAYIGRVERGEVNATVPSIVRIADGLELDPACLIENLTLRDPSPETASREPVLPETALQEPTLRELALREFALREMVLREIMSRETELREDALRETELREEALREEALRKDGSREPTDGSP